MSKTLVKRLLYNIIRSSASICTQVTAFGSINGKYLKHFSF